MYMYVYVYTCVYMCIYIYIYIGHHLPPGQRVRLEEPASADEKLSSPPVSTTKSSVAVRCDCVAVLYIVAWRRMSKSVDRTCADR